ncbi:pleckstrin homology domain-containing family B member 2 isoform X1 [Myxocyprinus asiaticus]|uniref:pleckstrin homology domain-containing family B member 2 isoform X1 n=1 Tax=Myxocyprinus asiaticus TaxID=70543 RepID=UPI00222146E6|nr:pleckstrin homology domain-containing family B member 2 isoform X1 [Myxocyprinus asiaticus]
MAIVKSGWLHRQSTILRRWKKNWFDLWSNGRLVFYNDQQRRDMEDEIHMRVDCINIRNANACRDLTPPDGKSKDSLLQIVCRDGRVISICADSADDALAWSMALQDARVNTVFYPDRYGGNVQHPPPYAAQMVYSADGQQYAVAYTYHYQGPYTSGVNHVIVQERRRDDAGDVALGMFAGAATGLALGSLFSVF